MVPESSLLTVLLGLAASFLGLAVLVQILQELYKFLTSSKGRAYRKVLIDFLGPLATELLRPGGGADTRVRGPFQLRRLRPRGMVLPMKQDELVSALEKTTPRWVQRSLMCLNLEVGFQSGHPKPPSSSWMNFLRELGRAEKGTTGYWGAYEVAKFLAEWDHRWTVPRNKQNRGTSGPGTLLGAIVPPKEFDAALLMSAFRKRFLPHIEDAATRYSQHAGNLEYEYRRRNLRQTFIIALLIALFCNLPFERIYLRSIQMGPDAAIALAERTIELYDRQKQQLPLSDTTAQRQLEQARQVAVQTLGAGSVAQGTGLKEYIVSWSFVTQMLEQGTMSVLRYLFGCLVTALLVSFGAPIWNDIASALLRIQKGQGSKKPQQETENANG